MFAVECKNVVSLLPSVDTNLSTYLLCDSFKFEYFETGNSKIIQRDFLLNKKLTTFGGRHP